MGITAHPYESHPVPDDIEPYREKGDPKRDRTGMSGTLDTTGIGPGDYEDLRNVTDTFDAADERIARVLGEDQEPGEHPEPIEGGVVIEGQGDRSTEEIIEALEEPGTPQANAAGIDSETNPVEGEPGAGQEEAQEQREEAEEEKAEREAQSEAETEQQIEENREAGFETDAERIASEDDDEPAAEEVVEGTVPEVQEHLKEHPEDAEAIIEAEEAAAEEEDREPRKGVVETAEKVKPFDPSEHLVGAVKEYFDTADDAEIERVKQVEAQGQNRPGIMKYAKS